MGPAAEAGRDPAGARLIDDAGLVRLGERGVVVREVLVELGEPLVEGVLEHLCVGGGGAARERARGWGAARRPGALGFSKGKAARLGSRCC